MPDSPTPVFPDLPEVIEPAWVKTLTPADRIKYDEQVNEGLEVNFAKYVELITSLPGFESVPSESVEHLATRVATTIQNIYDAGVQDGLDWRHAIDARVRSRDHHFAMMAVSAGTAGAG